MEGPGRTFKYGWGGRAAVIALVIVVTAFGGAVYGPASAASATLPGAEVGVPYLASLAGDTGGPTSVASITAGTLPAGLSLDPLLGVVSGVPTTPGVANFTASVVDIDGRSTVTAFALSVVTQPTVATTSLPNGEVGVPYQRTLAVSGGLPLFAWTVTGATLPEGLLLNPATGNITGTPSASGQRNFTVTVTDASGLASSRPLSILVVPPPTITTASLPSGEAGAFYVTSVVMAGGTAPFSWTITDGALPAGLSLNASTGAISGMPTTPKVSNVTLRVTDANRQSATKTFALTINVAAAVPLPDAEVGTPYRLPLTTSGGRGPFMWSIVVGSLPPGLVLDSTTGVISGTPTSPSSQKLTVMVTDESDETAQKGLSLFVRPNARTYWLVATDGGIFAYGRAPFLGSTGALPLNRPVVGMAATNDAKGYWLVASDGGVFAYGTARYLGSTAGLPLKKPIIGMVSTPDGGGYWLVGSDGGVFPFGTAHYLGSTDSLPLSAPIVAMVATADANGYWLVSADGGVFAFGNAAFLGSPHSEQLNRPVVGMAATPDGRGYWLVAADGGVFAYGTAPFLGSTGAIALNRPIVSMATTPNGKGYWLVASDGGVFAYGSAEFLGSTGGARLSRPIVGIAALH